MLIVQLITVTLLVNFASGQKKPVGCNNAVNVKNGKEAHKKFSVTLPLKPPNKCIYQAFGTEGCTVEIKCTVDIPQKPDCDDDFLKISDGNGGEKLLCGKAEGTFQPTAGLRDLFLVLETKGASGQVTCEAKCAGAAGNHLEKTKKKKIDSRCACGFQNKDDRIVGGEDAKMNEFPWIAAVVFAGTRSPNCGSAIINDRYVLTAAHCFWFEDKKPNEIEVLFHAHTLDMTKKKGARKDVELGKDGSIQSSGYNLAKVTDEEEKTQRYQIEEIINHPLFNEFYDNDYALLKLKKKIDLSDASAPTPICVPPADTYDTLMASWSGKMFTVAGWGMAAENAGGSTRVLQKLDVPFIDWPTCQKKIPADILTRRMLCAGYEGGGKDACTGDSGGPLVFQMPTKQFWQIGVVSWGEGCARKGKPGIYSRVTEMMQWINFHSLEGDAKWCEGPKPV